MIRSNIEYGMARLPSRLSVCLWCGGGDGGRGETVCLLFSFASISLINNYLNCYRTVQCRLIWASCPHSRWLCGLLSAHTRTPRNNLEGRSYGVSFHLHSELKQIKKMLSTRLFNINIYYLIVNVLFHNFLFSFFSFFSCTWPRSIWRADDVHTIVNCCVEFKRRFRIFRSFKFGYYF